MPLRPPSCFPFRAEWDAPYIVALMKTGRKWCGRPLDAMRGEKKGKLICLFHIDQGCMYYIFSSSSLLHSLGPISAPNFEETSVSLQSIGWAQLFFFFFCWNIIIEKSFSFNEASEARKREKGKKWGGIIMAWRGRVADFLSLLMRERNFLLKSGEHFHFHRTEIV